MSIQRQLLDRPARRAAILAAAARAFVDRGFAATSMDDVAAAAGVTKLILYRHFESKEELYEAVLQRVSDRLGRELVDGAGDRPALAAVRALLVVGREDPDAMTLLWRHAAREPRFAAHALAFRERAVEFARSLLVAAGVTDRLHERWAAETLVSYVVDALLHWLDDGAPGRDDEFLALMSASLPAIVRSWAAVPG